MMNWIGILCATGVALFSRFCQMKQSAFLPGVDAYYYALQIKFFAQTGTLKIPDSSLLLPLMGLTAGFGWSYEHTIIFWTLLIQLGCGVSLFIAYLLIHGKNHNSAILALLLAWVILSPTLAFTCIAFPKYAFSIIFLPLWPVGLTNHRLWPVSLAAVILACVSHLTMIGLLGLILFGLILWGVTHLNSNLKKPLGFSAIAGLILIIGLVLSKFFLLADLKRIEFQGLQPSLWTFFSRGSLPLLLKAEVAVVCIISIILVAFSAKAKPKIISGFWLPLFGFLLLVPLGSKEVMGIPERLSLLLPFITICSLAGIGKKFLVSAKGASYAFTVGMLVLVAIFPKGYQDSVYPDRLNPDYQLYDQITGEIARREIPMLITHQGLNYYYKYRTMKESFPYEPESHWPKRKIWRIVFGVTPSQWAYYLPDEYLWGSGTLYDLAGPYALIREDGWNEFREKIKLCPDDELKNIVLDSWLNPSRLRPEFARKRAEQDDDGEFSAYPGK